MQRLAFAGYLGVGAWSSSTTFMMLHERSSDYLYYNGGVAVLSNSVVMQAPLIMAMRRSYRSINKQIPHHYLLGSMAVGSAGALTVTMITKWVCAPFKKEKEYDYIYKS